MSDKSWDYLLLPLNLRLKAQQNQKKRRQDGGIKTQVSNMSVDGRQETLAATVEILCIIDTTLTRVMPKTLRGALGQHHAQQGRGQAGRTKVNKGD